jgi:4-hydroxybenzoate polyprenyltransferase
MSCITAAGFMINDLYDKPKDRLGSVQRPITVGAVSPLEAVISTVLLIAAAFWVTPLERSSTTILLVVTVGVVAYSSVSRRLPLLKGLYTALLCCAPLVYGASFGRGKFTLGVYVALILCISGREIYLDIRDIQGDCRFGLRTIPVLVGIRTARHMAVALMIIGSILTLLLVRSSLGYAAAGSSLALLILILWWPDVQPQFRLRLTQVPMLLGALALSSTVRPFQ